MAFLEVFDRVARWMAAKGGHVEFDRGTVLSASELNAAQSESRIVLPDDLIAFYAEVGDGLHFRWSMEPRPDPHNSNFDKLGLEGFWSRASACRGPGAHVDFPKLSSLVANLNECVGWRIEWNDDYDYRFTDDPKLARSTAKRMRKWTRFHDEGNGDQFCLDGESTPSPVVFDRHDWMDGGTGDNGHHLGDSLLEFYRDWSAVCFQCPSSLWWPAVFKPGGGVDWQSDEFNEDFRLPAVK